MVKSPGMCTRTFQPAKVNFGNNVSRTMSVCVKQSGIIVQDDRNGGKEHFLDNREFNTVENTTAKCGLEFNVFRTSDELKTAPLAQYPSKKDRDEPQPQGRLSLVKTAARAR
jgi:hypothetical protein